jgi:hypothetical protein
MPVNPKVIAAVGLLISLSSLGNMLAKTYAYGCGEFPSIFPGRYD